jgi:hypothetical protein
MQQRGLPFMRYLLLVSIGISPHLRGAGRSIVTSDSLIVDYQPLGKSLFSSGLGAEAPELEPEMSGRERSV